MAPPPHRIARIPERECWRPAHRLRASRDFQRVRHDGRHANGPLLMLGYARRATAAGPAQPEATRIGFSISKRVGDAVTRNRVKRRLREIIRRQLTTLAPGWDLTITARPSAAQADYATLATEVTTLLARAGLRHTQAPSTPAPPPPNAHITAHNPDGGAGKGQGQP